MISHFRQIGIRSVLLYSVYEFRKVPRATAEKCYRLVMVGDQSSYFIYMPDVVLVLDAIPSANWFLDRLDKPIHGRQNGMVAAPLQFFADLCFAGAGNAFNQIIPY